MPVPLGGSEGGDALSDGDEFGSGKWEWPKGVPTGEEVAKWILETRSAFQPAGRSPLPLSDSLAQCRDQVKKKSPPSFAFSWMLPEEQRHAAWCLHGVCSALQDAQTTEELDGLRDLLRLAFDAKAGSEVLGGSPTFMALRATLRRYAVPSRPFQSLPSAGARRHPPEGLSFETTEELVLFSYRSGGALGLVGLPVLLGDAAPEADAVEAVIALGMALQLTDLLNSIGHHRRTLGRRTVPREALAKHGIDPARLENNLLGKEAGLAADPRWRALMQELLAPVRALLRRASSGSAALPGEGRVAIRAAVNMCLRAVAQMERCGYDSFGKPARMFTMRTIKDVVRGGSPEAAEVCLGTSTCRGYCRAPAEMEWRVEAMPADPWKAVSNGMVRVEFERGGC